MRVRFGAIAIGLIAATGWLVGAARAPSGAADPGGSPWQRAVAPPRALLAAEDGRAVTRDEAAPILQALDDTSPVLVRRAVMALGRIENPLFIPDIRRMLTHADPGVRAEAAHALAHAAGWDASELAPVLRVWLDEERTPAVRGVVLEMLGRLAYPTPADRAAVELLLTVALEGPGTAVDERLGAAEGLENLVRGARSTAYMPSVRTLDALRHTAQPRRRAGSSEANARLRRLALSALNAAGAVDGLHARAVRDRDEQVRRLAVAGTGRDSVSDDLRTAIVSRALSDPSPTVRYEALRVHARYLAAADCRPELDALDDESEHVVLQAIDALGTVCPGDAEATQALRAMVSWVGSRDSGLRRGGRSFWSPVPGPRSLTLRASHAIVSLARRYQPAARVALGAFAEHPAWQVRLSAARAAGVLADVEMLASLAADPHDNVREEAISALARVAGHGADAVYLAALRRPAYQVVMAAARALAGTPDAAQAAAALVDALSALTTQQRHTSRDPRLALLARLAEVGGAADADALRPLLADIDPAVAGRAAEILTKWTGAAHEAATRSVAPLPLPSQVELDRLPAGMRVVMASGRSFDVAFDTWDSALTVWRVARLAAQGYYDGLTFHRVVPNFVIQGGSPGANEFVGDGPFMRDECSARSNLRGSIGISTRGRDTGDAQFYVNLVDNERLDHTYPVFGAVVGGMAAVDRIAEGDVIQRVELLPPDGRPPRQGTAAAGDRQR